MVPRPLGSGTGTSRPTRGTYADWAPDGERLAVVRVEGSRQRLEYPLGTVRFESSGWISHPRVSHSGEMVAFINHPVPRNSQGYVVVLGPDGKPETWSGTYDDAVGLAWRPGDEEVIVAAGLPWQQDALWLARRGRSPRLLLSGDRSTPGERR